jgi:hypothetical protein
MTNPEDVWVSVFQGLEGLRDRWPEVEGGWTYDRRLRCVVSSFPVAREADARAAMAAALPTPYSATTLASAPAGVQALAETCGGLRAAQLLFWSSPAEAPGAFGLWWPWGDGTQISLRVGLHDLDAPKVRYPRLRDIFGIPQAPGPG